MRRAIWLGGISLLVSGLLTVVSVYTIGRSGLRIGIDFKGGQLLELRFGEPTTIDEVRTALDKATGEELPTTTVAQSGPDTFLLRSAGQDSPAADRLRGHLKETVGEYQEIRFEQVGPSVGADLARKAVLGVVLASLGIILYIAWAFRRVPKPASSWRFGVTAVIALLHDLLITVGLFAVFGQLFGFEVDSLFITALLTVMGFSVHDTIVTYDRIRENLRRRPDEPFAEIVSSSIRQTIVRSINTSLTLVIVLTSLLLLGGSTLRAFIATLLVGVVVGTYSSIFVASQLLVLWQRVRRSDLPAGRQGSEV